MAKTAANSDNHRQIILDTETTGFDPKTGDRVIEIGCIELINRRMTDNTYHVYLNPQGKKVGDSFKVHGLSDEFLQNKPIFADIAEDFLAWIGQDEIIAHNATFDLNFLNHELTLINSPVQLDQQNQITDSLQLAKEKHPGQRNNLDVLCSRYKIDNSGRDLHGALIDADLLAQVYLALTGGQYSLLGSAKDSNKANHQSQYSHSIEHSEFQKLVSQLVETVPCDETIKIHEDYLSNLKVDDAKRW